MNLHEELRILREENASLVKRMSVFQRSDALLNRTISRLSKENEALRSENIKLEQFNMKLNDKNAFMFETIVNMDKAISYDAGLKSENNRLTAENSQLVAESYRYKTVIAEKQTRYNSLKLQTEETIKKKDSVISTMRSYMNQMIKENETQDKKIQELESMIRELAK